MRRRDMDLLRVCSMFAVVYLHTAAGALREPVSGLWHFSNLLSSLATTAVPLFFMLSGALLLSSEKTADIAYLLRRRLPKLAVPALVWSGGVILLNGLRGYWDMALDQLTRLVGTPVVIPYWFLYGILSLYLLSPFLKRMVDGMNPAHWKYFLVLWFGLTVGQNTVVAFAPGVWRTIFTENSSLNITLVGGYLGYFLLGAWLDRLDKIPSRRTLWIAAALCVAVIAVGTFWATVTTGSYDERFKNYLNLFAAALSTVLFLLFRSYGAGQASGRVLTLLSGLSFGVYLAHPLAIQFWQWLLGKFSSGLLSSVQGQIFFFALVLGSSLLGTFAVSSIKPLCFALTGQRFDAACRESNLFSLIRRDRAGT